MSLINIKNFVFKLKILLFLLFFSTSAASYELKNCDWNNEKNIPCITINKTPNTSAYSEPGINKKIITKNDIVNSGSIDINDVLKLVSGLEVFQSGPKGQSASVFTRGSESNHTLVLLNGIPINDQSVTDGLHDFGQDFVQTIQQIEVYKGANGAHFGPSAIAGAVNFITAIDYENNISFSGFNNKNNSINGNYTKITDNEWHLNFKASKNQSKTNSAIADGSEKDAMQNMAINLNILKWINDNTKFISTVYSRKTKADYDGSSTDESGYVSDNNMHAFQTGLSRIYKYKEESIIFHYHNYDRE